jgi:type I restriction enzyme S subunit
MRHCLYGSSKPGKRSFGRFSRPLLEVYFQTSFRYEPKVKSLAVAEIFRYCKGFRLSYSYFCLLDQKYKRGVVRTLLTPDSCCIADATWTTAKIGDLGSFTKGAPLSKADIAPDGTPFILYGELYTTYHEVINAVIRRTQAQPEKQYYSRVGDVIIPTSGETPEEISTAACVMLPDIILAGDLNIFRSSKIDGRIMSYILNHIVNGQIARIAQGKSVVHIQASELSKIEISYPDYNTQRKMFKIFDALNTRTEIAQKKLMALRCMQKALLQQLFM